MAPQTNGMTWFSQLRIMLRKNFILQIRYRKSTIAQSILAPIVIMLVLFLLQQLDYSKQRSDNPHPLKYPLNGLQKCQGRNPGDPCVTLMFTPDTDETRLYMKVFAEKNKNRTGDTMNIQSGTYDINSPPPSVLDIVAVPAVQNLYDYTIKFPNTTYFGVSFISSPPDIRYQIWFNHTLTQNGTDVYDVGLLSLHRGLDEAILTVINTNGASSTPGTFLSREITAFNNTNLDLNLKDWPKVRPNTLTDGTVSQFGSMFFFCSAMIIFISVLNNVVYEKEMRLRDAMSTMGLIDSVYWTSWFISQTVLVIINAFMTVVLGYIFNFTVFRESNFGILFFLFIMFGLSMVSLAFFITTFVNRSRTADILLPMFRIQI